MFSIKEFFASEQESASKINMDANSRTILNRMIGIVEGLFAVAGLFQVVISTFLFMKAYSEGNCDVVNMAAKQLDVGVVFVMVSLLIGRIWDYAVIEK